jgi:hypothetical protein
MKRPGLRASFPGGYAFRSEEKKRTSLLTAAFIAPGLFDNGFVRVHIFPTKPVGRRTWDCTVTLEFPVDVREGETAERQFAVFVRNGTRKVLGFDRRIQVKAKHTTGGVRRVSFAQPAELAPGTYTVTAVVGDSESDRPWASSAEVVVPPVPDGDVFLVPPILGRPAMSDVVVRAVADAEAGRTSDEKAKRDRVEDAATFQPLLVQSAKDTDRILALTQVCTKSRRLPEGGAIVRAIDTETGNEAFRWADEPIELEAGDGVTCRPLFDVLPIQYLAPGDYRFRASLGGRDERGASTLRVPFRLEGKPGS